MSYLLDTHVLLWYFEDSPKLSESVAAIIDSASAQKSVSVVSLWEFSIKSSLNKLSFEGGLTVLWEMITINGFTILPIQEPHLSQLMRLPFLHRDPFDRLLIATAVEEKMTLMSADENIHQYDVQWIWE
ncbi:MAG: type II toxin-antitoxin system VapC family toxin [Clostridiales Family XIII bacterium]|jgi:PIN domain nuclease of toxin-antitoxin system|nr:type II toxin-antitoxin system VapC family toxin [Clostridiales Family XIII bacterium]